MIEVKELIEALRKYVGTPYKHQGRSIETGVDCLGLVVACANDLGIEVVDEVNYSLKVNPQKLLDGVLGHCCQNFPRTYGVGELALMKFGKMGATHLAVITDKGIIHSYNRAGEVVEHRLNPVWKSRIVATFKINGVKYE